MKKKCLHKRCRDSYCAIDVRREIYMEHALSIKPGTIIVARAVIGRFDNAWYAGPAGTKKRVFMVVSVDTCDKEITELNTTRGLFYFGPGWSDYLRVL